MKSFQQNIALISSNPERLNNLKIYITSPKTKIYTFDFQSAFSNILKSEIFDLIIFDLFPNGSYDIKRVSLLRKDKLHQITPFLYLIGKEQSTYKMEIYKDEYSSFLFDPIDKFELLNSIKHLDKINNLEKRLYIYKDVLEGEKQLVNNLDKLLQINLFLQYQELSKAFEEIQFNFIHKMELTFAVEKVVYLYYLEKENSLRLNVFDKENKTLMQRVMFDISKSTIQKTINSKIPYVLEGQDLLDPFIQEIEETIGFEINSGGWIWIKAKTRKTFLHKKE